MKKVILLAFALGAVFLWVGTASAGVIDITVFDQRASSATGWYGIQEDDEVEPGMVHTQEWDLEKFLLDGSQLSMVGGYNFVGGFGDTTSGDIFIDTDGDALYGDAANGASSDSPGQIYNLGWDYVIDVNWDNSDQSSYNVYQLTGKYVLDDVKDYNSPESSPWQLVSGGLYKAKGTFSSTSFSEGGKTHYQVGGFDLSSFLGTDLPAFTVKFTMECGNDNLIGKHPVPEPATMLLLGVGLIGMAGFGRRKLKTK